MMERSQHSATEHREAGMQKAVMVLGMLTSELASAVVEKLDPKEATELSLHSLGSKELTEQERVELLQAFFSTKGSARLNERLALLAQAFPERAAGQLQSLWRS